MESYHLSLSVLQSSEKERRLKQFNTSMAAPSSESKLWYLLRTSSFREPSCMFSNIILIGRRRKIAYLYDRHNTNVSEIANKEGRGKSPHLNQLCSASKASGQGIHTANMSDKDVFNICALPPPIILQFTTNTSSMLGLVWFQ